ncbi:MAG: replicative DNA helicase [Candidatus Lloydbacteria bacterium RIFCSPHIGHO2_02_FULL_51_22]|uniref:Replicative DNA helicase n=2 Tax=Candidatus Lloydiibacteriota TaxID=1817910 RepID=A0A1G2DF60_9BACT|nr:MAG: replicative DNA helicase [Candidatus Lloydbacteria bacterium RIFCSPHIGHO2_02_FULL_51_22]OGZ15349.1 MAG: replicative DNA helicase [Candidatus Lloydbacteria bacterium RIFCSPLOWO2_02_FULL_51_11]
MSAYLPPQTLPSSPTKNIGGGFRVPPQDIENEKALLGSIMLKQGALFEIEDMVRPDSFYAVKHRIICEAMLDLHRKNEPIDILSVASRLAEKKQLETTGGRTYLAELVNVVPSSANLIYYAEIIQRKHILRKLIEAADAIGELGYNESADIAEILDGAEKRIFGVSNMSTSRNFTSLKDGLGEAFERLDRLHKSKGEIRGVPTGFKRLDNLLAGLQNSDLVILAARPSVGKTSLAMDIARNAASKHNIPIGIFSLETSAQQLVDKMLSAESLVDSWKLRTGSVRDEDFEHIQHALDRLSKAPIYINDVAGNSLLQIRSVSRRMKAEHGIRMIVVDYLQLITPPKSYESMVQQVTEISRGLKGIARELNIPVLALSQLSRAVEQRRDRPRLSDLRDSGALEQDADVVMFIHREDRYKDAEERNNIAEILVEKHRNGPLGKVELYFDEKRTTFKEIEEHTSRSDPTLPRDGAEDSLGGIEDDF